jgi:ABC-2 type transport system permease protein
MHRILGIKLRLSASVLALLTTSLVLIASLTISLPWHRVLFFALAIVMLSFGLTALALALGTLIPNFRESNPARIVSGFGGTLCLIASFLYILACMATLVFPAVMELRPMPAGQKVTTESRMIWESLALAGVLVNTIIFGVIPYFFAKTRTVNLEYLRHLN